MGKRKGKVRATLDRRIGADRRALDLKLPYDRRVQPDRRLNNISVEFIPIGEVTLHPTLRNALRNSARKRKAKETKAQ